MSCETDGVPKEAKQRYQRAMAVATVVYVIAIFAAAYATRRLDLPQWAIILISLLPVVPALVSLRAYITYTRAMDEFHRRLNGEAVIIAAGVIGFGSFAYGFLEAWAGFPPVSMIFVFPFLCGTYGIAYHFVKRRYQ